MKGRTRDKINPTFDDFVVVSRKQVELAMFIRQYRRIHNLSQKEMAKICTLYGNDTKFTQREICSYENYEHIPTPRKFQAIMNTMDIVPSML